MNLNLLEKSILATIAYYDILDCPLTGFEVFKYLINPSHLIAQSISKQNLQSELLTQPSFLNILKGLEDRPLKNFIEKKNGFYFLKGRQRIVRTRIKRQKISDQKWKKVKKVIRWLEVIPYLKLVVISGSLALNNVKKQSDIDLLIVAKHRKIWTVRFLIAFFTHLIGKRRHGKKTANRLCLNHYITDKSLKIDLPSLYNAQTYAHLIPILQVEKGIYNKFQKANQWIKSYLAFYPEQKISDQRLVKTKNFFWGIAKFQEVILDTFLGNILEKILSLIQKKIIKYHSLKEKGEGRVITDDFRLEFHPASPEVKTIDNYNKNILKLGLRIKPEQDSGLIQKGGEHAL